MTYALAGQADHGTVSLQNDGRFTYLPAANFHGDDSFTVTVSDGRGVPVTLTVTLRVASANDLPVGSPVSYSADEDTGLSGAALAVDADGDLLTYTLAAPATHGSVSVAADGSFTYRPAANWFGSDRFTVRVDDGQGGTATLTVSVEVASVNDRPQAGDLAITLREDSNSSGTLLGTDAEGDLLTYALGTPATLGTATVAADGSFTYTPRADAYGTDSFTILVSDGQEGTAEVTVGVTILAVNDAPGFVAGGDVSLDEDAGAWTLAGWASHLSSGAGNEAGQALAFTVATNNAALFTEPPALDAAGNLTFRTAANAHGTATVTVTLQDDGGTANGGSNRSVTHTFTISVLAINDAPVVADLPLSTPEDTAYAGQITATDPDGDPNTLTYALETGPTYGTAVVHADGTFTFTPAANSTVSDAFTVAVSDGQGGVSVLTVTFWITAVSDAPLANPDRLLVTPDTPLTFSAADLLANDTDADGDLLTITEITPPLKGTLVDNANGTWTYTSETGFTGTDSLTYSVSDGVDTRHGTVELVVRDPSLPAVPMLSGLNFTTQNPVAGGVRGLLNARISGAAPGHWYELSIDFDNDGTADWTGAVLPAESGQLEITTVFPPIDPWATDPLTGPQDAVTGSATLTDLGDLGGDLTPLSSDPYFFSSDIALPRNTPPEIKWAVLELSDETTPEGDISGTLRGEATDFSREIFPHSEDSAYRLEYDFDGDGVVDGRTNDSWYAAPNSNRPESVSPLSFDVPVSFSNPNGPNDVKVRLRNRRTNDILSSYDLMGDP